MAKCGYSEPVFVGSNPRFPYARSGYLPSYCPACPERFSCEQYQSQSETPVVTEVIHRHINYQSDVSKKQWHRIDAISGEVKYLHQKITELLARKKKGIDYEPF